MVGHLPLEQSIGVRIPGGQPKLCSISKSAFLHELSYDGASGDPENGGQKLSRTAVTIFIISLTLSSFCQDQPQPATPELTIKAFTKLVQVPAVVTDKAGNPVRGLTKEDFILLEDGNPVKISTFQAATPSDASLPRPQLPSGQFTNIAAGKPMERPIIILVVDATNSDFFSQAQARRHLIRFLSEKIEPGTLMSLMVSTRYGFKVVHEYTTDPAILTQALKQVVAISAAAGSENQPPLAAAAIPSNEQVTAETQAMLAFANAEGEFRGLQRGVHTDIVLQGLRTIAQRFAGVPGRKALIWAGANFPTFRDDPTSINSTDFKGRFLQTFDQLTEANIAVYPIDAGGLIGYRGSSTATAAQMINPGGNRRSLSSSQVLGGSGDTEIGLVGTPKPIDSMKVIAELTGGVPYYGTNDLSGAMRKAFSDSTDYYMLGYYLRAGSNPKLGRRKLKVQVRTPGLKVRSRERVYVTQQSLSPRDEMQTALRTPMELTNIPMIVKFDASAAQRSEQAFEIALSSQDIALTEGDNILSVSFVVQARNAGGTIVEHVDETMSGKVNMIDEFRKRPFLYGKQLRQLSGATTVHFIVRDNNSGKMGSVIVELPKTRP
jgi:VWFA-related protein